MATPSTHYQCHCSLTGIVTIYEMSRRLLKLQNHVTVGNSILSDGIFRQYVGMDYGGGGVLLLTTFAGRLVVN